jgi:hypothetical protein
LGSRIETSLCPFVFPLRETEQRLSTGIAASLLRCARREKQPQLKNVRAMQEKRYFLCIFAVQLKLKKI